MTELNPVFETKEKQRRMAEVNNVTVYTELVRTIPVVIGGFLGFGAAFLGQLFTDARAEKRERKKLEAVRLERLLRLVSANNRWLEQFASRNIFSRDGRAEYDEPPPLDEIKALQTLYFPELVDEVKRLDIASDNLILFAYKARESHTVNKWQEWLEHHKVELQPLRMNCKKEADSITKKCALLMQEIHPYIRPI